MSNVDLRLGDCLEIMRGIPDKSVEIKKQTVGVEPTSDTRPTSAKCIIPQIDCIITDPPYGIGFAAQPTKWQRAAGMKPTAWDDKTPCLDWLLEMQKPTIIWGGNYFDLPLSRCWLAWVKPDAPPSMGNVELAWTNYNKNSKHIVHSISATNKERAGHPTQKPLRVMKWVIQNFTKEGDTIFDPFAGSGTTLIAALQLGRNAIGIEINPDYFAIAQRRIAEAQAQLRLELA